MSSTHHSQLHHSHIEHILCLYDFSESNKTALMHAVTMAQKFKAKLFILNIKEPYTIQKIGKENYAELAKEKIQKEVEPFRFTHGVSVDIIIEEGKYDIVAKQIVDTKDIDIIVLDIDPYKGRNSCFTSSHVTKLAQFTSVPVLAVKSHFTHYDYKKVLFPLDESQNAREKIPYAKRLGEAYHGSEVIILGLDTNSLEHAKAKMRIIVRQAEEYVFDTVKNIKVYLENTRNKTKTLLETIDKEKPDIILVMSEGGSFLSKAPFEKIIDKVEIPVVVVPPRVEMVAGRVGV